VIVGLKMHKGNWISRFVIPTFHLVHISVFVCAVIMRLSASSTLALAALAAAHPGEDHHDELEARRSFEASAERLSVRHCAETLKARGVTERNIKRRSALIEEHRRKRK